MSATCIGEPVSWLRLEMYALDPRDAAITEHVTACPACGGCLAQLRADTVALPSLALGAAAPRRRWWLALVPAFAAAAALLLFVILPRKGEPGEDAPKPDGVARVKGITGEIVLGTVRERSGDIRMDMGTFRTSDRWKVVITCVPGQDTWVDLAILDGGTVDYPLGDPQLVPCGNRVVVPGAFSITGDRPNRICVRIARSATSAGSVVVPEDGYGGRRFAPPRPGEADVACVTVRPE